MIWAGYAGEALRCLNRVRISLQVLFLSDVLTASGDQVSVDILLWRPKGKAWSTMRLPKEQPTDSDMRLWNNTMKSICPSRSGTPKVGEYASDLHRVWRWFWNKTNSSIHHVCLDSTTEEVYVVGRKTKQILLLIQPTAQKTLCHMLRPTNSGRETLATTVHGNIAPQIPMPHSFVEVLQSWGNTWLWEHMTVHGGVEWLEHAITEGTLVAVTDGSYIHELYPNLCSTAFVLECSSGRGQVCGYFWRLSW